MSTKKRHTSWCIQWSYRLLVFVLSALHNLPQSKAINMPRQSSLPRPILTPEYYHDVYRDPNPPWYKPDTSSIRWWWQQAVQWWPSSTQSSLKQIIVRPVLPNGTLASPASLWLPKSQLRHEYGFRRIENQEEDISGSRLDSTLKSNNNVLSRNVPWYSYNSSEATPLVPASLAWMTDASAMGDRAQNGGLDIDVARQLSKLVAAAYCNPQSLPHWNCSRCEDGFTPQRAIFDPLWDLQGFVGWSDVLNGIVIAFRGTDSHSYYNWVENMRTWRTDLALSYTGIPPHALVHGGFFYSYNNSYLADNITAGVQEILTKRGKHPRGAGGGGSGGSWNYNNIHNDTRSTRVSNEELELEHEFDVLPTVFVTGHSLGGALATLCALDLKISLNLPDVRVVSFGSPRVGNYVFSKWFEAEIGPHWRFTHNRDIVPSVPPGYMGFHHVPEEVWVIDLLSGHTLVGVCDDSGEDPRCHNSVCHLGLCSSVADHLLYLSEMYSPHPHGC